MEFEFIKEEIKKVESIIEILNLIKSNKEALREFNLEIKVIHKGFELHP